MIFNAYIGTATTTFECDFIKERYDAKDTTTI